MIAFVRSETSERTDSASTPKVSSSMSQKTTSAPVAVIAWWQATYVYEGQMISSPGPAPASWQALCSAAVPLESASRWRSCSARRRILRELVLELVREPADREPAAVERPLRGRVHLRPQVGLEDRDVRLRRHRRHAAHYPHASRGVDRVGRNRLAHRLKD
jgi:hypothetical protein